MLHLDLMLIDESASFRIQIRVVELLNILQQCWISLRILILRLMLARTGVIFFKIHSHLLQLSILVLGLLAASIIAFCILVLCLIHLQALNVKEQFVVVICVFNCIIEVLAEALESRLCVLTTGTGQQFVCLLLRRGTICTLRFMERFVLAGCILVAQLVVGTS